MVMVVFVMLGAYMRLPGHFSVLTSHFRIPP